MKGKYVNLVLGIMNAFVGILILIYSKVIPEDILSVTIQEMSVINIINIALFALLVITAIINILYVFINRKDKIFCFGYLLGIFAILFIPIHAIYICTFSFMSALIIIIMSLKENMVDVNNMVMISIVVTIIGLIIVLSGTCFAYKWIGEQIRDKDNEGELKYSNDFFKYITELDIDDIVTVSENKIIKFNSIGYYKISFNIYGYVLPSVNPNEDFFAIGFGLIDTDNIYIGGSKFVYEGDVTELYCQGIIAVNDTNNEYGLVNLSPKELYLNSPDLKYIKSDSYFTNSLVTMVIEYYGK